MAIVRNNASKQISFVPDPQLNLKVAKIFFYYDLVYMVIILFSIYMDLFLLYLVFRFTRNFQITTGRDSVLERDVPSILFIQN